MGKIRLEKAKKNESKTKTQENEKKYKPISTRMPKITRIYCIKTDRY